MVKYSLKRPQMFLRSHDSLNENYYGCEQDWYQSEWQKQSGCGPTTACNILSYMEFSFSSTKSPNCLSKQDSMIRMQESWEHVTPGENGIPTTRMFCEHFLDFAKTKDIEVSCNVIDINETKDSRPSLVEVVDFIKSAMLSDSPVAFLNLCNGQEKNLDEWHWVTIISVDFDLQMDRVIIEILDEGKIKIIDLKLWYETTVLGGGFVYFK